MTGGRWRYYAAAGLLAVVWYGLLWGLVPALEDLPGGANLHRRRARLRQPARRSSLAQLPGSDPRSGGVVAVVIAVALGLALAVYAVFFEVAHYRAPSAAFFPIVAFGAVASGWLMLSVAYAAVPALVLTFLVTSWAARTLPRSDGES